MSLSKMFTTRNVSNLDRTIRAIPSVVVVWLYYANYISGALAIGLAIFAGMLLMTTILGSCSIYYLLGFSTCPISGKSKT